MPAHKLSEDTMLNIKKNWNKSKRYIIDMILLANLDVLHASTEGCVKDRYSCAVYISETIENMYHQLNGKKTLCRFSAHTVDISISIYLYSKKSYNLRESGLLCLPHTSTLKKITNNLKVKPGGDLNNYLPLKVEMELKKEEIIGHLMMDKIKLKNGIAFNCNSNDITGFLTEQLNTKKISRIY